MGFTLTEGADTAPTITEEPTSIYANTNSPAQFSLTVSGSSPMTYQWQKELVDLTAETNSTYNINAVRETDAGEYRCIAGNPFGSVTSDVVTLTIDTNVFAEGYALTETGQASCYDTNGLVIVPPTPGEATAGTIPTDADSNFPVTGLSDTNITWTRELDRSYTLQYATNFTNEFQSVESGIVTTAPTNNDLFESDLDTVFFRVIVE